MSDVRFRFVADDASQMVGALNSITEAAGKAEAATKRVGTTRGVATSHARAAKSSVIKMEDDFYKGQVTGLGNVVIAKDKLRKKDVASAVSANRAQEKEAARARRLHETDQAWYKREEVRHANRIALRATPQARMFAGDRAMGGGRAGWGRSWYSPFSAVGGMTRAGLGRVMGSTGSFLGSAISGVGNLASAGMGWGGVGIGGAAVLGGTMALAKGVKKAQELQDIASDIAVQTRVGGRAGEKTEDIQNMLRKASMDTGGAVTAVDVGEAAKGFLKRTGSPELMKKLLPSMATFMAGTGTSGEDIGKLSGVLVDPKSGVLGKDASTKEYQEAMGIWIEQGRTGAVELEDMANQMPKIIGGMKAFGISGMDAIKQVGAAFQASMTIQGSAQQGSTSVRNLLMELAGPKGVKMAEQYGVTPFKNGQRKDLPTLFADMAEAFAFSPGPPGKAGKKRRFDMQQLSSMKDLPEEAVHSMLAQSGLAQTFDTRAARGLNPFVIKMMEGFSEARSAGKTEDEARKIGREKMLSWFKEFETNGKTFQSSVGDAAIKAGTLTAAWEQAENKLASGVETSGLLEHLQSFATAVGGAAPAMEKFASTLGPAIDGITRLVKKIGGDKEPDVPPEPDVAPGAYTGAKREEALRLAARIKYANESKADAMAHFGDSGYGLGSMGFVLPGLGQWAVSAMDPEFRKNHEDIFMAMAALSGDPRAIEDARQNYIGPVSARTFVDSNPPDWGLAASQGILGGALQVPGLKTTGLFGGGITASKDPLVGSQTPNMTLGFGNSNFLLDTKNGTVDAAVGPTVIAAKTQEKAAGIILQAAQIFAKGITIDAPVPMTDSSGNLMTPNLPPSALSKEHM